MAKVLTFNQALKLWVLAIVSAGLLYSGGYLSDWLISPPTASIWMRWLGVAVAVGSIVPWLFFIAWALSTADEYHRHVVLVGTAMAFVGELLAHIGFNVMQDARIVSWSTHLQEIPVAMILWVLGIALSAFYQRLRP